MKLAFSNIAWPPQTEAQVLHAFRAAGLSGIEVAPTRLWPDWNGASPEAAANYAQALAAEGFSIPAMQAILFGKPALTLFGSDSDRQHLLEHLVYVADLAVAFGAKSLVFGAPKNRQLGDLTPAAAFAIAREFFTNIARLYESRGVCLCLEANPTQYACTFVTNSSEAAELVRSVHSPGFGLHLDAACLFLAGEDAGAAIQNNIDILRHFHVSEPYLNSLAAPQVDHAHLAAILRGASYDGWISLEMRETDNAVHDVAQAATFLARTYKRES